MDVVNPIVKRWLSRASDDPDGFWSEAAVEEAREAWKEMRSEVGAR